MSIGNNEDILEDIVATGLVSLLAVTQCEQKWGNVDDNCCFQW